MKEFIEQLKDALEREAEVKETDSFREYDEWDSIAYLSVIAFMDECYNTQIEEEDFKKLKTVKDLYEVCANK